jgi:DNA-binding NarL/FixJ family response regulator
VEACDLSFLKRCISLKVSTEEEMNPEFRKPRLLIADDYELIRALLVSLFRDSNQFEIVGEASTGSEAIQMTRMRVPDAVIMDIEMPQVNGIEATRTIHAEFPNIRIIGLSMHDEPELREGMLRAGAVCCLSKNESWDVILADITEALDPAQKRLE